MAVLPAVDSASVTTGRAVTLVVSDLKGSTALAERLDAESLRSVLTQYFDVMRTVVESRGGTIVKIIGDAIVAVFDTDPDPETAAWRAARAVLESHEALVALNERFDSTWGVRLQNRTGIASGTLASGELDEAGTAGDVIAGDVVGAAEALESASPVGSALIDDSTLALLGDAATTENVGPVARKGGTGTVDAWQLLGLDAGADPFDPGGGPDEIILDCPACGAALDGLVRRCAACGTPFTGRADESRRTVTILFADPRPVPADGDSLSPDATRAVMSRYIDTVRPILERHGGTVEKFIGDALMAVFGLPVRHEDDAARAVRAAEAMQVAIAELNASVYDRFGVVFTNPIGVNTGTVVAGDHTEAQRLVTGDAVNVAARLEQTGSPGQVILGELTRRLAGDGVRVAELEPLVLKGKAEPVPAFLLVSADPPREARSYDLPLVGRDDELAAMCEVFESSVRTGRAGRMTVVGDAGVGKSRLTHEFLAEAGRSAGVVCGSCLAYGEGITFWPLLRVVHDVAGITEDDDAETAMTRLAVLTGGEGKVLRRLASIAGLIDTPYPVGELVWALHHILERLVSSRPLVMVLEDIHWAEPTLLDVIEQLTHSVRAPVTLLCTARPSVLDSHSAFVEGAPAITIGPFTDEQCERFLRLVLGGSDVDAATVSRIVERAAGNPLFLEQLLSMLIDDGRLHQVDGSWRVDADLSDLDIPASIEALLAARLDRLPADQRRTVEPASVVGLHFAVDALTHLVDAELRSELDGRLDKLAGRDLVLREPDEDPTYRFQHQLIRDATYGSMLKHVRAVLHERLARWAESKDESRDRSAELDEILGYHLEQAYRYWDELGPLDEHVVQLGLRASQRLSAAGERALARGDMSAAANLLTRSSALLPTGHPSVSRLLLLAGNALHEVGSFDEALAAYEESTRAAETAGDSSGATAARIEGIRLGYLIGRVEDTELVLRDVADALERVGPGDCDALSRIWQLQLNVEIAACRWAAAQRAADQVIAHARRAGNTVLAVRTMPLLAFLAQKGPMPVPEARAVCGEIRTEVAFDRRSTSLTQLELALLSAMALDVDEARRMCGETRRVLGELGWEMQAALVSLSSGPIELLADEPVRAEAELRRDYEALDRLEERNFISLTAVLLAEAVYRQRRLDEARELVEFGRRLAAPDDLAVQIIAAAVQGKLAARAGDPAAGLDLVDEAVRLMEGTDDPSGLGDVLLDRAEVLLLSAAPDGAAAAAAAARAHYLDKGNQLGAARAERIARALIDQRDPLD